MSYQNIFVPSDPPLFTAFQLWLISNLPIDIIYNTTFLIIIKLFQFKALFELQIYFPQCNTVYDLRTFELGSSRDTPHKKAFGE